MEQIVEWELVAGVVAIVASIVGTAFKQGWIFQDLSKTVKDGFERNAEAHALLSSLVSDHRTRIQILEGLELQTPDVIQRLTRLEILVKDLRDHVTTE